MLALLAKRAGCLAAKKKKKMQKLQHPVFPSSLLRQY